MFIWGWFGKFCLFQVLGIFGWLFFFYLVWLGLLGRWGFFFSYLCVYFTGSDFLHTIEQTELLDAENLVNFMDHFHMEISFYFPSQSLFLIQLLVRFTEQKHWVYYGKKSNQCSTKGQSFRVFPVAVSQTRGYYEVTLSDFNQNTHLLLKRLPATTTFVTEASLI